MEKTSAQGPLEKLEQWDDFVASRYKADRTPDEFRQHTQDAPSVVREFYRLNHTHQTRDFVEQKRRQYLSLEKQRMSVWEAMKYLNTLVDDSDPDTDLSQIQHLLQTAEAIRRDGNPHWMVVTGLIHDLGKILWLWGEPQWAVVGDTFPVGCSWSDKIVFHKFFELNADHNQPRYQNGLCGAFDLPPARSAYLHYRAFFVPPVERIPLGGGGAGGGTGGLEVVI